MFLPQDEEQVMDICSYHLLSIVSSRQCTSARKEVKSIHDEKNKWNCIYLWGMHMQIQNPKHSPQKLI